MEAPFDGPILSYSYLGSIGHGAMGLIIVLRLIKITGTLFFDPSDSSQPFLCSCPWCFSKALSFWEQD